MVFFAVLGSPPRMRGKVVNCIELFSHFGITPAYAGKRRQKRGLKSQYGDHPRVCGEKINVYTREMEELGSPPRMRGKGGKSCPALPAPGITPAYAGKSCSFTCSSFAGWDHPRVCGEKIASAFYCFILIGSPPRMRGKVCTAAWIALLLGITPAYAGKRKCAARPVAAVQDHPRVCGEKTMPIYNGYPQVGSPPRMRGKAEAKVTKSGKDGITPAYAGKSKMKVIKGFST